MPGYAGPMTGRGLPTLPPLSSTNSTCVGVVPVFSPAWVWAGRQRAGCDLDHAVAIFFATVNSHCYQLLAGQLGWSPADWQRWLTGVLGRELLGTSP